MCGIYPHIYLSERKQIKGVKLFPSIWLIALLREKKRKNVVGKTLKWCMFDWIRKGKWLNALLSNMLLFSGGESGINVFWNQCFLSQFTLSADLQTCLFFYRSLQKQPPKCSHWETLSTLAVFLSHDTSRLPIKVIDGLLTSGRCCFIYVTEEQLHAGQHVHLWLTVTGAEPLTPPFPQRTREALHDRPTAAPAVLELLSEGLFWE